VFLEVAFALLGVCALPIAAACGMAVFGRDYSPKKGMWKAFVSVVIPTYNEEKLIRKKLENIFSCYPRKLTEVIVVDCSADKTAEIAGSIAKKGFPVRVFKEKKREGVAQALNYAYSKAKGEIVVKTDCDSLWPKNALEEAVADFADERVGAVTGAAITQEENSLEKNYRSFQKSSQAGESKIDSTVIFHGPFCAFRRSLIEKVDPQSIADDTEEAIKIRLRGARTILDPSVTFFELSPTGAERLEQKSRRAHGLIKAFLQHAFVLFNPGYGLYGLLIFPANFFNVVAAPWLLASAFGLAAIEAMAFSSLPALIVLAAPVALLPVPQFRSFFDLQLSSAKGMVSFIFSKKEFVWKKSDQTRNVAELLKISGGKK